MANFLLCIACSVSCNMQFNNNICLVAKVMSLRDMFFPYSRTCLNYLRQGDCVFGSVCLSVFLFSCVLATLLKTLWIDIVMSAWNVMTVCGYLVAKDRHRMAIKMIVFFPYSRTCFNYLRHWDYVFSSVGLSFWWVCQSVSDITQNVMNGLWWNSMEESGMVKGTSD